MHGRRRSGTIDFVDAERLVALEAALAELGGLYTAARNFTALEAKADKDLLPRLTRLSARLRALHRGSGISEEDIDAASRDVIELRAGWLAALDTIRASALFRDARRAFDADDQEALARLIPQIFAGFERKPAPAVARFGVSAAVRRRGPGTSPFLSPEACAEKIADTVAEGVAPHVTADDWWLIELPSLHLADSLPDLDTPFAVSLPASEITAVVFATDVEVGYRIFTPRLEGTFAVEIASTVDDEWWQAFEQPYEDFRAQLETELASRGIACTLVDVQ